MDDTLSDLDALMDEKLAATNEWDAVDKLERATAALKAVLACRSYRGGYGPVLERTEVEDAIRITLSGGTV